MLPSEEATTAGATEGEKYLCLDSLIQDVNHGDCMVYSFGISDDWTFEHAMATVGCQVFNSEYIFYNNINFKTNIIKP